MITRRAIRLLFASNSKGKVVRQCQNIHSSNLHISVSRLFSDEKKEEDEKKKTKPPVKGKSKEISLEESLQIFGFEDENQIDIDELKKKWAVLKKSNNIEKGGSPYLYYKIRNAIERISKHLKIKSSELDPEPETAQEEPKKEEKKESKQDEKIEQKVHK